MKIHKNNPSCPIYVMFPKASKSLLNTFHEFVPHLFIIILLT
jgi:hypothetical protein